MESMPEMRPSDGAPLFALSSTGNSRFILERLQQRLIYFFSRLPPFVLLLFVGQSVPEETVPRSSSRELERGELVCFSRPEWLIRAICDARPSDVGHRS